MWKLILMALGFYYPPVPKTVKKVLTPQEQYESDLDWAKHCGYSSMEEWYAADKEPGSAVIEVPVAVKEQIVVKKPNIRHDWFCVQGLKPSPAEEKIARILSEYDVKFYQEVAFSDFKSSAIGFYRYDFYIPSINTCIEYDSKLWHSNPDRVKVDTVKNAFCWNNNIGLKRYSNSDYYALDIKIVELMKRNNIKRK